MNDNINSQISILEENEKEKTKDLFSLAKTCIKEKKFEDAKNYYKLILDNEPENLEALYMSGFLYMKNNLYKKALEYFNKFINLKNDNPFVYEYMGIMDAEKRTEYFNKAIEINDNTKIEKKDYSRYIYIAFKTYEFGEYDIALNYSNYIYNVRQINGIINLLGCIYYRKGDYDRALSLFHDLNFIYEKSNIYILCNISSCYRKKNSNNMAIRYLEKAKEIDDNNKLIYYNLGSIYTDMGNKKSALENIDKALSIDNDYEDAVKLREYINNLD